MKKNEIGTRVFTDLADSLVDERVSVLTTIAFHKIAKF